MVEIIAIKLPLFIISDPSFPALYPCESGIHFAMLLLEKCSAGVLCN